MNGLPSCAIGRISSIIKFVSTFSPCLSISRHLFLPINLQVYLIPSDNVSTFLTRAHTITQMSLLPFLHQLQYIDIQHCIDSFQIPFIHCHRSLHSLQNLKKWVEITQLPGTHHFSTRQENLSVNGSFLSSLVESLHSYKRLSNSTHPASNTSISAFSKLDPCNCCRRCNFTTIDSKEQFLRDTLIDNFSTDITIPLVSLSSCAKKRMSMSPSFTDAVHLHGILSRQTIKPITITARKKLQFNTFFDIRRWDQCYCFVTCFWVNAVCESLKPYF